MKKLSAAAALVFLGANVLQAAISYKGQNEVGIHAGVFDFEGDTPYGSAGIFGGRLGHYFTNNIGGEVSVSGGSADVDNVKTDLDLVAAMGELQYHFGKGMFRPFVAIGAGVLNLTPESIVDRNAGDFIVDYGVGAKWMLNSWFGLRADARHVIDTDSGIGTHNLMVTGGFSLLFDNLCSCNKAMPKETKVAAPGEPVDMDSDHDGVLDSQDQCPDTAQTVQVDARGCPLDTDGDGVTDRLDDCPGTPAGTAVNSKGCPEGAKEVPTDNWVLEGVQFETNSDKLMPQSIRVLDEAADILRNHSRVRVEIQGHTDSFGKPDHNKNLSERRAASVKKYLVGKGIAADRLETKGFGETQPIADNKTVDGRFKNRRIEFKVLSR